MKMNHAPIQMPLRKLWPLILILVSKSRVSLSVCVSSSHLILMSSPIDAKTKLAVSADVMDPLVADLLTGDEVGNVLHRDV